MQNYYIKTYIKRIIISFVYYEINILYININNDIINIAIIYIYIIYYNI